MPPTSWYQWQGTDLIMHLRIQPRASRNAFAEIIDSSRKVRITAAPVDGKANEQLITFLARAFGSPKSGITIIRGENTRQKTVRIPAPARLPEELGLDPPPACR